MSLRSILLQFKKSFSVSPLAFQLEYCFDFIVSSALASFEALPQFHLKQCVCFFWSSAFAPFEALPQFHLKHCFDFIWSNALASFEALPQFHLKQCVRSFWSTAFFFVCIDVVTTVLLFEQVNFWRHQLYWPPRWRWRRPTGNGHFQLTEFDSNFNPTDGRTSKQS